MENIMSEDVNATQEAPVGEPVQLGLQDIATMVQVIDIVSRRGGFEGQELEAIGGLRNRIVAFLNAAAPKDGKQPEGTVPVAEEPSVQEEG
jgi:hypothetical protein